MLTMTQTHDIRKNYYDEGKSITQISRETEYVNIVEHCSLKYSRGYSLFGLIDSDPGISVSANNAASTREVRS
jgi:hypothetical protein